MSLAVSLNNALTGLNVSQQALSVLSQNIANANTPGYSRQVLNQAPVFINGVGSGVKIDDITRKVDEYLRDAVQDQSATLGKNDATQTFTDRIQVLLGQPGSGNSIVAGIEGFFNNLQSLAETPEVGSFRVNAVNGAVSLARQLSDLASQLQDLRYEADRQIKLDVDQVNNDLINLYSVNTAIVTSGNLGRSTAELLDKRDGLVKSISQRMNISVSSNGDNSVAITTTGGVSLLDGRLYELSYEAAPNAGTFINDGTLSPLRVWSLDSSGERTASYQDLTTSAPSLLVTTRLTNGSIKGLTDLRDSTIPGVLDQLDIIAAALRDGMNAIHNSGSGFPPASQFTGTRAISGQDIMRWDGAMRLMVFDGNGRPAPSGYTGDSSGKLPLNLDLSFLDSGQGQGLPKVQTIIDEINSYFSVPQKRVEVGNLNNIQLVSDTTAIPNNNNLFAFDFDLQNISGDAANFFVTSVSVQDENGVALATPTDTLPSLAIDATSTFTTTSGSNVVTVAAAGHGLIEGQRIFMPAASADVNGIPAAQFNGYFTVSNVTDDTFEITLTSNATSTGVVNDSGLELKTVYHTIAPGEQERTRNEGLITADLSANNSSNYYTVTATVGVDDGSAMTTATISYRVYNNSTNMLNRRYSVESANGGALVVNANTTQSYLRATLVDAQGREVPKTNGVYSGDVSGYLKLDATSGYTFALDDLTSQQQGVLVGDTVGAGSDRGFSHFFELNNFFNSNKQTETGDTLKNSAINLSVAQRLRDNSSLISLGSMVLSAQPRDATAAPLYTYERNIGDNKVIQKLAKFGVDSQSFAAAGGLAASSLTVSNYAGQVLGYISAVANRAKSDQNNTKVTLEGFQQRANAVSGVNLDEELANTVIYQNAYTASARIITVTNQLFDTLLKIGQ